MEDQIGSIDQQVNRRSVQNDASDFPVHSETDTSSRVTAQSTCDMCGSPAAAGLNPGGGTLSYVYAIGKIRLERPINRCSMSYCHSAKTDIWRANCVGL
jgi:hypothetical protein